MCGTIRLSRDYRLYVIERVFFCIDSKQQCFVANKDKRLNKHILCKTIHCTCNHVSLYERKYRMEDTSVHCQVVQHHFLSKLPKNYWLSYINVTFRKDLKVKSCYFHVLKYDSPSTFGHFLKFPISIIHCMTSLINRWSLFFHMTRMNTYELVTDVRRFRWSYSALVKWSCTNFYSHVINYFFVEASFYFCICRMLYSFTLRDFWNYGRQGWQKPKESIAEFTFRGARNLLCEGDLSGQLWI